MKQLYLHLRRTCLLEGAVRLNKLPDIADYVHYKYKHIPSLDVPEDSFLIKTVFKRVSPHPYLCVRVRISLINIRLCSITAAGPHLLSASSQCSHTAGLSLMWSKNKAPQSSTQCSPSLRLMLSLIAQPAPGQGEPHHWRTL